MEYNIRGTTLQVADIQLNEGETIYTQLGGMAWRSPNIAMKTEARGGFFKSLVRTFIGENFFLNTYTCQQGTGVISVAAEHPGKIIPLQLGEGQSIICQKDGLLCAQESVTLEAQGAGTWGGRFFGGEGMLLQKLKGPGMVFLELCGEITEYELQQGQMLYVDTGHVAAFQESVTFDVVSVDGMKNKIFGGEGLFLTTVEGPGKVYLQSLPLKKFARKIGKYIPKRSSSSSSSRRRSR